MDSESPNPQLQLHQTVSFLANSGAHSRRDAAHVSTNFIKYCCTRTYAIEKVQYRYVKDEYHHFKLGQPLPWILPRPCCTTSCSDTAKDKDRIEDLRKRFGLTPARFQEWQQRLPLG
jgi:hypothetical protein